MIPDYLNKISVKHCISKRLYFALSQQNIRKALYFENCFFRMEQLTMFSVQNVLY